MRFVVVGMGYLRQLDAREEDGYGQHDDTDNGIGNGHIAVLALLSEEELAHQQGSQEAAHAVEGLREVQPAR